MKLGFILRIPCYPHLNEQPVLEEFKILYHYTSWSSLQAIICCGIFPGATSCKGHVCMTMHAPWEIKGKDPGVRTNRPLCIAIDTKAALLYGIRLVETMTGAIITEDWVTNAVLIYAFDCEKSQYLWGNRGYNGLKIHLKQTFSEKALEWKENEARKGTPDCRELGGYIASDMVEITGNFES